MKHPLQGYLDFAIETAYLAGRLTLGYFQAGVAVTLKADRSPVTIADQQAETLIRSRIEERFPGHAIVGEELGEKHLPESRYRWLIDPIDGTKAFIHGVPLYGVLIGLEIDGVVEVGAAYFPALDEMLSAASGLGCRLNGREAHVSPVNRLEQAVVVFTDIASYERCGRVDEWKRLQAATSFQSGWSDAYGYMLVATGRAEIALDPVMNLWDCAPFPPIFKEAGGYFGDWQGTGSIYRREALATSNTLLPEVLRLVNGDD